MGLDSIVYFSTAVGAGAALAPTTAVIKGNTGDAYIVGAALYSSDMSYAVLTCPGDPRWEAAGVKVGSCGSGLTLEDESPQWFPVRIPIKCGATLVTATEVGAADSFLIVYVEYPGVGDSFRFRDPKLDQPHAFLITKMLVATAGTNNVIHVNAASDATFQRGKSYTPVAVNGLNAVMTTAVLVGIQNTKVNLTTFWHCPLTPVVPGSRAHILPYGLSTVDGGETQFIHVLSTTGADTPTVVLTYAYQ